MFCQKCGTQYENAKFCPECGASADGSIPFQQPQQPPIYQPYQLPVKEPKKKKKGCLIAFLVCIGIILIPIGIIVAGILAEENTKTSETTTSIGTYRETTIWQAETTTETVNTIPVIPENTILIYKSGTYITEPNSAGGCDLYVHWINKSDKVIKYIFFHVTPYNAVGDKVYCEIRSYSEFSGKSTGPFKKNEGNDGSKYWECAWYNNSIDTFLITSVDIEYMDGTSLTLDSQYINKILR